MKETARGLAQFGRYGDNNLVHVSNKELRGLEQLTGRKFTQNPHTGLPEAFGWTDLIPIAAGVAGTVVGGPLGGAAASGLTRAAVTAAEGGSAEKALTQGLISGVTSYAGGQLLSGVGEAATQAGFDAAAQTAAQSGAQAGTETAAQTAAQTAASGAAPLGQSIPAGDIIGPVGPSQAYGSIADVGPPAPTFGESLSNKFIAAGNTASDIASQPGAAFSKLGENVVASPFKTAAFLGGSAMQAQDMLYQPPKIPGETPYNPGRYPERFPANPRQWNAPSADYRPGYSPEYRYFAKGGLASLRPEGNTTENLMNEAKAALLGEHPKPREAIERFRDVFGDGALQSLRDRLVGGRVKGAGGGLDDLVPGDIEGRQRVRLADSEFVLPADIVSAIGDGSTDHGVRRLHEMMDNIRKQKTGSTKQPGRLKKGTLIHEQ